MVNETREWSSRGHVVSLAIQFKARFSQFDTRLALSRVAGGEIPVMKGKLRFIVPTKCQSRDGLRRPTRAAHARLYNRE